MTRTGKTPNSMIALIETGSGLPRAMAAIGRLASAARHAARAVRLFDFGASLSPSRTNRAQGQYQAVRIPFAIGNTALPHLISKQQNSTVRVEAGPGMTGGQVRIGGLSSKTLPGTAKVLQFFDRVVGLLEGTVIASSQRIRRTHPGLAPQVPALGAAYAQTLASFSNLGKAMLALVVSVSSRALLSMAHAMDGLTRVVQHHPPISAITAAIAPTPIATAVMGAAHFFFQDTLIPAPIRGWQNVLRLLSNLGVTSGLRWLGRLASISEFGVMPAGLSLGRDLVIIAPALAAPELHRQRNAAKWAMSRWIEAGPGSGMAQAGNAIAALTAGIRSALQLSATPSGPPRAMTGIRIVENAAIVAWPALMPRTMRRAAAAAAFAAPLMLAGAPAGARAAAPPISNHTLCTAIPPSAVRTEQNSIVINYAPNVTIHSEEPGDTAALTRRVMEVLERHGRELHQVLAREMVRQQRQDF